jgi:hypothetical protein
MDEGEFMRLLERYPVARKKTHCRVQWNDMVRRCLVRTLALQSP